MTADAGVLSVNNDFPVRTAEPVHGGKVRSVYWLSEADSRRLIEQRGYRVPASSKLAVMIISDRLSAFDCIWRAEGGLDGVPGKGAALNAIAAHWFDLFRAEGLARSHLLEQPHPLVWIVQRAEPLRIEAIARRHITGSMWRAYARGERVFCGIRLPEGLKQHQRLPELLITPSTKGVIRGVPGVPEADDANIDRDTVVANFSTFGFRTPEDVDRYEHLLCRGFEVIERALTGIDQVFVDTKFEFGYAADADGAESLIYMDEVGTPDSSRIWDGVAWRRGEVVEQSKEGFRQALLGWAPDPQILLDGSRMPERQRLAADSLLPQQFFLELSRTYLTMAQRMTNSEPRVPDRPREEVLEALSGLDLLR
jgi:phosphoribosylaminoimidazole-succinocarboxamide synthase